MNLIEAVVTKVIGKPTHIDKYKKEGVVWWEIEVEYNSYGQISTTKIASKTREGLDDVKEGYEFLT